MRKRFIFNCLIVASLVIKGGIAGEIDSGQKDNLAQQVVAKPTISPRTGQPLAKDLQIAHGATIVCSVLLTALAGIKAYQAFNKYWLYWSSYNGRFSIDQWTTLVTKIPQLNWHVLDSEQALDSLKLEIIYDSSLQGSNAKENYKHSFKKLIERRFGRHVLWNENPRGFGENPNVHILDGFHRFAYCIEYPYPLTSFRKVNVYSNSTNNTDTILTACCERGVNDKPEKHWFELKSNLLEYYVYMRRNPDQRLGIIYSSMSLLAAGLTMWLYKNFPVSQQEAPVSKWRRATKFSFNLGLVASAGGLILGGNLIPQEYRNLSLLTAGILVTQGYIGLRQWWLAKQVKPNFP